MLQRAASNAYSWWWASHVRTKQSRWLDNDLQEMEDRVKSMVMVIEEDGDTFAKKAELYFQKRPELLNYVEETYRSYRGLADRYDHVSRELHKANHTIAQAFPDQVQLAMQEDDGNDRGGYPKAIMIDPNTKPTNPPIEMPQPAGPVNQTQKKARHRRISSHLNKDKAQEEIDRLQKEILGLQTEKEFVKSTYESGVAKYWDIESQINDLQEEVTSLQEAFSASAVIEDDEARALMAARAIKSCEDTLVNLQESQRKSSKEARVESRRIQDAKKKIKVIKGEPEGKSQIESVEKEEDGENNTLILKHVTLDLNVICQMVKEHFASGSEASVVELAERIDELVEKVISLELTVSSQGAQIQRLKTDTNGLQKQVGSLEEDKSAHAIDSNQLNERLKQVEDELRRIQQLERCVQEEKEVIQSQFTEACNNFANLSEQLKSPKGNVSSGEFYQDGTQYSTVTDADTVDSQVLHQLLIKGLEGRDKSVLDEYTAILKNYKDTKRMVSEMEKKNQEYHHETMVQVQELKTANAMKDDEIQSLRRILSTLKANITTVSGATNQNQGNPPEGNDVQITDEIIKLCQVEQPHVNTEVENKLREDIDTLLEENLDFWLRFCTSYHQIQQFQTTFDKLKAEADKIKELASDTPPGNDESTPVEKKLRELNTDLQVWLEKNLVLKGELESRSTSLRNIKEEISKISKESDEMQFTPYQAAKFQGEIGNMQQENNKVAKELQAGLDHVRGLQVEIGKLLLKLRRSFALANSRHSNPLHNHFRNLSNKTRIPLRTFLFGTKPKKQSIFSCMNPALQKQYSDLRAAGFPT
ncbi:protein NETWORKED 2A-like [Carex rostrata]